VGYEVGKPPATWVNREATRRERHVWLFLAALGLLTILICYAGFGLHSFPLEAGLVAVLLLLRRPVLTQIDEATKWVRGAGAETSVGETLEELSGHGFVVMHDIQTGGANLDHVVSGPSGVFLVETKLRRYEDRHLTRAKLQAVRLHDQLDVWVTPVICLAERRRQKSPYRHSGVWIVTREQLTEWLSKQRNQVLPFERLARYADQL
jgi:hypothetical protein